MSRNANCWCHARLVHFYESLKLERVCQRTDDTRDETGLDIVNLIEGSYNGQRLHWSIRCQSSVPVERGLKAA